MRIQVWSYTVMLSLLVSFTFTIYLSQNEAWECMIIYCYKYVVIQDNFYGIWIDYGCLRVYVCYYYLAVVLMGFPTYANIITFQIDTSALTLNLKNREMLTISVNRYKNYPRTTHNWLHSAQKKFGKKQLHRESNTRQEKREPKKGMQNERWRASQAQRALYALQRTPDALSRIVSPTSPHRFGRPRENRRKDRRRRARRIRNYPAIVRALWRLDRPDGRSLGKMNNRGEPLASCMA